MLRVHLAPGQRVVEALLDDVAVGSILHLSPTAEAEAGSYAPFGGKGTRPAPLAGSVAELTLESSAAPRTVKLTLE